MIGQRGLIGDRIPAPSRRFAVRQAFATRDFRLFCLGETISLVGDQFYLLAMPWLVLRMTGSPLAVGAVTAAAAIPRALLMLLAGTLSDRFSPRLMIMLSNAVRMSLVVLLALLTMAESVDVWTLGAFALFFGAADAFYFPARGALVPRLLPTDSLLVGNATVQAANQLAMFLGPLLAGNIIAFLTEWRGGGAAAESWAIGGAFAIDALAFLASIVLLSLMGTAAAGKRTAALVSKTGGSALWPSLTEGMKVVGQDAFLRTALMLIGVGNFLITGPLYVGIPVLVETRYAAGPSGLGLILSLFGAGSLLGVSLAAVGHRLSERNFFRVASACCLVMGAGLIVLGSARSVGPAAATVMIMGLAQGYLVVQFLTILQQRTRPDLLGRVTGLLMFLVVGLSPLSSGVAGALMELTPSRLLIIAGAALILLVTGAALLPSCRPDWDAAAGGSPRK